ncbi:MAG TPA: hypothetical protein VK988_14425, partial [Acidimicrobiales bacterium]|nr:hypothetical protein [Acidimicrobiales bacterium]
MARTPDGAGRGRPLGPRRHIRGRSRHDLHTAHLLDAHLLDAHHVDATHVDATHDIDTAHDVDATHDLHAAHHVHGNGDGGGPAHSRSGYDHRPPALTRPHARTAASR